ncbi:MAG: hypothetical protein V1924_03060 [Candidatus Bathyarchaeota archaeon]
MSDNAYMRYPFQFAHYFIPEFLTRMRMHREVEDKPSPRQGITMGRLLLAPFLRKGYLSFNDLLNAAVVTSGVDSQKTAEKIAVEIMVNAQYEDDKPQYDLSGDNLLSLLSKATQESVYVTPHGKGLENEFAAAHNSDVDIFTQYKNQPRHRRRPRGGRAHQGRSQGDEGKQGRGDAEDTGRDTEGEAPEDRARV